MPARGLLPAERPGPAPAAGPAPAPRPRRHLEPLPPLPRVPLGLGAVCRGQRWDRSPLPKPAGHREPRSSAGAGWRSGMEARERCPPRSGTHRPRPLPGAGRRSPPTKFLLRSPGGRSGEGGEGCVFQRRKKVTPPPPAPPPASPPSFRTSPRPPPPPPPAAPPAPHAMAARRGGARPVPGAPLAPWVPSCLFIPGAHTAFPPPPVPPRPELHGNALILPFSGRTHFSAGNVLVPTPECWHRGPWSYTAAVPRTGQGGCGGDSNPGVPFICIVLPWCCHHTA